jgi:hypothetical protein
MPFQKEWAKNEGILLGQLETRIVRFHNIFGPLGTWQGGREKAPAALCRKIAAVLKAYAAAIQITHVSNKYWDGSHKHRWRNGSGAPTCGSTNKSGNSLRNTVLG